MMKQGSVRRASVLLGRATVTTTIATVLALSALGFATGLGCGSSGGGASTVTPSPARTAGGAMGAGTGEAGHHEGGHHEGEHHPRMPPTVHAYHEVLRPLWHSDPGAERDGRVCAQAGDLVTRADAVVAAGAPAERQADPWRAASAALAQQSRALQSVCVSTPRGNVAGALATTHEAFHRLIEVPLAPGATAAP